MKTFKIKSNGAKQVLNLKEQLVLCDQIITTSGLWNNNPFNDIDVETKIIKNTNEYYYDPYGVFYPKEFLDNYYEEFVE